MKFAPDYPVDNQCVTRWLNREAQRNIRALNTKRSNRKVSSYTMRLKKGQLGQCTFTRKGPDKNILKRTDYRLCVRRKLLVATLTKTKE